MSKSTALHSHLPCAILIHQNWRTLQMNIRRSLISQLHMYTIIICYILYIFKRHISSRCVCMPNVYVGGIGAGLCSVSTSAKFLCHSVWLVASQTTSVSVVMKHIFSQMAWQIFLLLLSSSFFNARKKQFHCS